jgi:HlyD family secretion protein
MATKESEASADAPPPSQVMRDIRDKKLRRRNLWRWTKRIFGGLVVLTIAATFVLAWMPKPVPVEAVAVEAGEMVVTVDEDGRTRVKDRYVVSAPLGGNLARIELDAGDSVKRGAVLARLVPTEAPMLDERSRRTTQAQVAASAAAVRQAAAQVERAKAALQFAKNQAKQEASLAKSGISNQLALDRALLDERTAEAELASARFAQQVATYEQQMAQAALGRLKGESKNDDDQLIVPSPIEGRVLKVIQESEGVVQAGTPLLELGDPKALEIAVDVLTSDAVHIAPGAEAFIERWGGEPLKGRVRMVEPSAFTRVSSLGVEEQRVNAVIDLEPDYDHWKALGDGYRVEARIVVWRGKNVLKVPTSSVFRHGDGWATFVVSDGVASLRPVEIGRRTGTHVQVVTGVAAGEQVVKHPSDRVVDGAEVEVR